MLVLSVGFGYIAAGRALRPVDLLTEKAKHLSDHNLDDRLAYDGPQDELKELADTLDGMLERLSAAFVTQRSFSASVSHELRTPLAILQAEADLATHRDDATDEEKRFAEVVAREATRASALLDSLLTLARTDSTMRDNARIDLADVSGDVVAERIEAAEKRGVHLDLELGDEPVIVDGDPWLLERLVANLVDNAITHNHEGGSATVAVRTGGSNGSTRAVIEVHNTGDVLDANQVAKLTEPFQRADRTRPGHGLGMSIMRAVTEAHAGTFEVRPQDGGGLDVIVELPAAPPEPALS
jgi:signal transduction histidine kinase